MLGAEPAVEAVTTPDSLSAETVWALAVPPITAATVAKAEIIILFMILLRMQLKIY
jgi:hypothetical protein